MVDENTVEGTAREYAGKAQEAVGDMLGDTATQAQGKANEYAGKAQQYAGQAQETLGATLDQARDLGDQLTETTKERPLTALLVVGAVSFALGYLLRG